ncbi:hypothetical protein GCM10009676_10230 [Prauserella halophila]|uniref:Helix-turn-helix domain-containing protein n=1 Tax=Prauserella halophila TaxID=185641 RepID=A0ABN1W0B4_9PSEU|nr:helix-turn-helix domain-containing protein [Prauserella halophila]MCP2235379.1 hypothetical protein [Prauserella halophila]
MDRTKTDGKNKLVQYLTTDDVAERYRTSQGTVRYWRHIGYGPKGVKCGARVLYPVAECEKFDRQLAEQIEGAEGVA